MCGRNALFVDQDELEARFDADVIADGGYQPRYNIAPTDGLEVITNEDPDKIDRFHWGLIPAWADDPKDGLINARSETVAEKSVFKHAWETRPCLVLSSGFYEWKDTDGKTKQPYRIYRKDDPVFAMAGVWEEWEKGSRSVSCVTVLTTTPNELMEPLHHRMPVVLPNDAESMWLTSDPETRRELCVPYTKGDLVAEEISTKVNDPTNDDPSVVKPLEHTQSGLSEFGSD